VAAEGADAFTRRIDGARLVPDFEARRVVAQADLGSARGRDHALEQVRPLVGALPANSATRDDLVRFLADRLDVPLEYVTSHVSNTAPQRPSARAPGVTAPAPSASPDAFESRERTFYAMCLAAGPLGSEYLERVTDEHFSSDVGRRARAHLTSHFEDPLADLPADDPPLIALITDVAMRDQGVDPHMMAFQFEQLERDRVERQLRRAVRDGDEDLQRALAPERMRILERINELMGQAV
jgi:DNA primase